MKPTDLFTCRRCGAQRQIYVKPSNHNDARMICYGCRIKNRCDIMDDGCWLWKGATRGNYGIIRVLFFGRYSIRNVHRVAYAIWVEPIEQSWSVLHLDSCRQQLCCNPSHLHVVQQPLGLGHAPMKLRF